jgi:hypothetical protein
VTVRGAEVSEAVVQINAKVVERGDQSIPVLLGEEEPEGQAQSEDEDEGEDDEE